MQRFILLSLISFCLCLANYCSAQHYVMPYDNVPITGKTWEEIDITWPNWLDRNILNYAKLLRPISYAHKRGLIVGHHVHMPFDEFGVANANVSVTAIKPIPQQEIDRIHNLSGSEKPIIGFYVHQANDVKTYTFKDTQDRLSIIHATPIHPFYVKNLQTYIPINKVTDTMYLVGRHNKIIRLICPKYKHQHCGTPYHKGKITTVYNIEVYQQHFYRVGSSDIKVHNPVGVQCGPITPQEIQRHFESEFPNGSCTHAALCMLAKTRSHQLTRESFLNYITEIKANTVPSSNFRTNTMIRHFDDTNPSSWHDIAIKYFGGELEMFSDVRYRDALPSITTTVRNLTPGDYLIQNSNHIEFVSVRHGIMQRLFGIKSYTMKASHWNDLNFIERRLGFSRYDTTSDVLIGFSSDNTLENKIEFG